MQEEGGWEWVEEVSVEGMRGGSCGIRKGGGIGGGVLTGGFDNSNLGFTLLRVHKFSEDEVICLSCHLF